MYEYKNNIRNFEKSIILSSWIILTLLIKTQLADIIQTESLFYQKVDIHSNVIIMQFSITCFCLGSVSLCNNS